jgi:hypothetical protein
VSAAGFLFPGPGPVCIICLPFNLVAPWPRPCFIAITLQKPESSEFSKCRVALASLLCVSLLFSGFLASSPLLHLAHHDDASQESHECLVSLIAQSHVSCSEPPAILLFTAASIFLFQASSPVFQYTDHELRQFPERGPPAAA